MALASGTVTPLFSDIEGGELRALAHLADEGRSRLDDVVWHLTALEGIGEAFERLRRGVGARTVVVRDEALAGAAGKPLVA
jgi:Zn-dependent alcohol dehydrogenase